VTNNLCACGEPTEWIDIYCQECWEEECETSWQQTIKLLFQPMLIKITEQTHTVFFQIEDIVRIIPIFLFREVDYYRLDLKGGFHIKISITQLTRLTPFLSYVDLSINLDKPEELTIPLDEDFDRTMSELLDMAIKSPNPCPNSNPWLVITK
jgi:hypothetical protein